MTCFWRDLESNFQLMSTLQNFAKFSGLRINDEETEIFAIGPQCLDEEDLLHKIRNMIIILGTFFSYDNPARAKTDFDSTLKSIREILNSWKGRILTLIDW